MNETSYEKYSNEVIKDNRYIYSGYVKDYLRDFKSKIHLFKNTVESITVFRAQKGYLLEKSNDLFGNEVYVKKPFKPKRMKPIPGLSKEGRINPKGISYLYLSDNIETCIMETRPWIEEIITIATFRINKKLNLIDFSNCDIERLQVLLSTYDTEMISKWVGIQEAFSKPVSSEDDNLQYVPTQILAEIIKSQGYDGIVYKSRLSDGINIALFNLNDATCMDRKLYWVNDVKNII